MTGGAAAPRPANGMDSNLAADLAIVLIGRNEGERLLRCLASIRGQAGHVVYVDSGSTDGSVAAARAAGAAVVELDLSRPFTAARARNAGFQALAGLHPAPAFIQFIDGDCAVAAGWLEAARTALQSDASLAVVTGWRSEIDPGRSVYNAICDTEWHRPAGPITACGGDMMVRRTAFEQVLGFNDQVIAAEDDEFCIRIGQAGWKLLRLPLSMTRHDAAMTTFGQWWRRAVRAGHGFAQVGALHEGYFRRSRQRVLFWGAALPGLALIAVWAAPWALWVIAAAYLASFLRSAQALRREGLAIRPALHQALFLVLSKFPNLQGMITYYGRQLRDREMRIIEYK